MTWAESIVDPDLQETTVMLVATSWMKEVPESVSAYFVDSDWYLRHGPFCLRDSAVGILRAGESVDALGRELTW